MSTTKPKPIKQKKKRPLNKMQKEFAKGLAKDLPVKTAALLAGYAPSVASSRAYEMSETPQIRSAVDDMRERNRACFKDLGFDHLERLRKIKDLTDANKTIVAFDDLHEVPDSSTQLAATKEALKLCGDYPTERLEVDDRRPVVLITNIVNRRAEREAIEIRPGGE